MENGQRKWGDSSIAMWRIGLWRFLARNGVSGMVSRLPIEVPAKAFPLKWIDSQKRTESQ